jgi:hypothetical protein
MTTSNSISVKPRLLSLMEVTLWIGGSRDLERMHPARRGRVDAAGIGVAREAWA